MKNSEKNKAVEANEKTWNSTNKVKTSNFTIALFLIIFAVGFYYWYFQIYAMNYEERSGYKVKYATYMSMLKVAAFLDNELSENNDLKNIRKAIGFGSAHNSVNSPTLVIYSENPYQWYLIGTGPDMHLDYDSETMKWTPYDPTNGINSAGDIVFSHEFSPMPFSEFSMKAYSNFREARFMVLDLGTSIILIMEGKL